MNKHLTARTHIHNEAEADNPLLRVKACKYRDRVNSLLKSGSSIGLRFKTRRAWLCAGAAALLLGACATPQKITGFGDGPAFERAGRFALNVSGANGQREALQGGFAWRDTGRLLVLDLANPLGSILARIDVSAASATLTHSDGRMEQAPNPDALVEEVLGSPMPVRGLRDWLQGKVGDSAISEVKKDEDGHISGFSQDGWRVRLSRYDNEGPRLLQMNRSDTSRNISVRLVVDDS
ncbi:outer membrane lipoprotein LolB [Allopusillimonas ginsengisoli]|nr:outer membrane lipoprotein LolB [Allopusillimonas ginsengisoli]